MSRQLAGQPAPLQPQGPATALPAGILRAKVGLHSIEEGANKG